MTQLDASTPEQHRKRYETLKRNAEARAAQRPPRLAAPSGALSALQDFLVVETEEIPEGWYWTARIRRGESLRVVNPTGRAAVSMLLWNADDTSERYNAGDTVKIQWNALLGKGHVLFSDMGRVLASITEDSGAGHDALTGGSTAATNLARYGSAALRNTRDNFLLAAAKFGMGRRDVMPCLTFFAPVRTTAEGAFCWQEEAVKPGDFVELRAEMNLLVVLSNCPHPLDPRPDYAPGIVEVAHWRSPPAKPDDLCRTASEEAVRGFENTDPLFA